jgi:integrase
VGFRERQQAEFVLGAIRVEIARGTHPEEACTPFLNTRAGVNLVPQRYERWLEVRKAQVEAGDLSPRTIQEYEHYRRPGGEIEWWGKKSIFDINYGSLQDWSVWLSRRGLAPATRQHVLGAFRTFTGWLRKRGAIRTVPEFPTITVPEYTPTIVSPLTQDAILEAIPEPERGAHLVAALMGLRSGEARALAPGDYVPGDVDRPPMLRITKAMKTLSANGVPGPTKNKRNRILSVPDVVVDWIEAHWDAEARIAAVPEDAMFANPRSGKRWSH